MHLKNVFVFFLFIPLIAAEGATVHLRAHDEFAGEAAVEYKVLDTEDVTTLPMAKRLFGEWEAQFDLAPGSYAYRFVLDGTVHISDFSNSNTVQAADKSVWSVFTLNNSGEPFINFQRSGPKSQESATATYPCVVEYNDPDADAVMIAGEFNQWAQEPMRRAGGSTWRTTLLLPEGPYGYKFVVDGKWIFDPANEERVTVNGTENSLLVVDSKLTASAESTSTENLPNSNENEVAVTFQFYAPQVDQVSVVGTFNDWNPVRHPMKQRGDMWEAMIHLAPGTYEYKFKSGNNWWSDPNNPDQPVEDATGNSPLTVRLPDTAPPPITPPLIRQKKGTSTEAILLEPATRLHAFQQELYRAYLSVIATERYKLNVVDGSLLLPHHLPPSPAQKWGWNVEMKVGLPVTIFSVGTNSLSAPLNHPLFDPPRVWLAELREFAGKCFAETGLILSGPTSPPPGSAWARALKTKILRKPFADVYAVNTLTAFGRSNGWSRALLRDIAITYAGMAESFRFPSISGWSPNVFAARAVVYADLARGTNSRDETLAVVLNRIGRPKDAAAMLPEKPVTLEGKLTRYEVRGQLENVMTMAGTPDHYGFDLAPGEQSREPQMESLSRAEKSLVLRTLADMLKADERHNLARIYWEASLKKFGSDFYGHIKALEMGSVSAGHRHANVVLKLAGCRKLWSSILDGNAPQLCLEKTRTVIPGYYASTIADVSVDDIENVSAFYQAKQRELLDTSTEPIPQKVRLLLLRDCLNVAWWHNAYFYGSQLYTRGGSERIKQLMISWSEMHPEMDGFTRFLMSGPMNDHSYDAMSRGLKESDIGPDTLSFLKIIRRSFRTWLLDKAQGYYPNAPFVLSDLLNDYADGKIIYQFQGTDFLRANYRRIAPMNSRGYPKPGPLPQPHQEELFPGGLLTNSFGLNKRLAESWKWQFEPQRQKDAITFYRRCLEIAPYETSVFRALADVYMDNGRYEDALKLVQKFPGSTEGLEQTAMERLGAFAALEIGDITQACALAKSAADSWQGGAMLSYAYMLELNGQQEESLDIVNAEGERYGDSAAVFSLIRLESDDVDDMTGDLFDWIEQFQDLDQAHENNRFSFNEFKSHPFYYAALGQWDRALWLLKPLAEAVGNDYMWFMLLTVGQKMQDQEAVDLAQHVLANHVHNVFGEFPRFMRGESTWAEVINYARSEGRPQPPYLLAAIMADQRGDKELAIRHLKHALAPRFGTMGWFTMAWNELKEHGVDPYAFAKRSIVKRESMKASDVNAVESSDDYGTVTE